MNKRIKKKKYKEKINTPTKYLATGGFHTPYACPNCKTHYTYSTAYYNNSCVNCNQKLIWWEIFKDYSQNVRQKERKEYHIVKQKKFLLPLKTIKIKYFPTYHMASNYIMENIGKNIQKPIGLKIKKQYKNKYYISYHPSSASIEIGSFPTLQMAINYAKNKKQKNIIIEKWYGN